MRIYEITTVKHIKPLNAAQARLRALQYNAERARNAIKAERGAQRRQREREREQLERRKKHV